MGRDQLVDPGGTDPRWTLSAREASGPGRYWVWSTKHPHLTQNSARDKNNSARSGRQRSESGYRFRQEALAAAAIRHQKHYRRHRLWRGARHDAFPVMEFVQGPIVAGHHGRRRRDASAAGLRADPTDTSARGLPPPTGKKLSIAESETAET